MTKRFAVCLCAAFFLCAVQLLAKERVVDGAGLLNATEAESLKEAADLIAAEYNFDLVIVTRVEIGGQNPRDYAADFFDNNGYGLGEDRGGALFLQVTDSRDYWFSTSGRGISIMNGAANGKLEADALKRLKEGSYYEAYRSFLDNWRMLLEINARGRSYNFARRWNFPLLIGAWVLSLVIAFLIVAAWKKGLDAVSPKSQALGYMVPGSLVFREKKDRFLFSTVSKTAKPKQSNNSAPTNTFRGSSGRSHGGSGGKY